MFEGLNWRVAFKRAAIFTAIWLGLVYALDTAFPGSFGIEGRQQIIALAFNGVLFFFLYAVLFAFFERRRSGRRQSKAPKKEEKEEEKEEPGEHGSLKGRHNPNTSRKKSQRRRTRR